MFFKSRKKGKINYYIPKNIESIEFKVSPEGFCSLSLPPIPDSELPSVSIITPTKNRGFIFKLAIYNFYNFIYPPNKLEWVILDNGNERVESLLPNDKRIKYIKLDVEKRLPMGEKRNVCVQNASHNLILHMDDDDYYPPESLIARVKCYMKYRGKNIQCLGCNKTFSYDISTGKSALVGTGNKYFGESSLIYTKNFWKNRNYENNSYNNEILYFLEYRQNQCMAIPSQFVTIAFTHNNNITKDLRRVKKTEIKQSIYEQFNEQTKMIVSLIKKGIKNSEKI